MQVSVVENWWSSALIAC